MEDPNSVGGDTSGDAVADANSMAYAAAEAAAAAAAEEQHDLATRTCRICNKGGEDGRAMIHFPAVETDPEVSQIAPHVTTFAEDIVMHVFCGKTASILPKVNMPQYEILSKAGIKNKHGIGTEVNTALARTRCATVAQPGVKEKQFYIVQEFEANLTAVRMASGHLYVHQPTATTHSPEIAIPPHPHHMYAQPPMPSSPDQQQQQQQHAQQYATTTQHEPSSPSAQAVPHQQVIKSAPARAAAGITMQKHSQKDSAAAAWAYEPPPPQQEQQNMTADGKIKCACGGTHLPTGTSRGAASWRAHVLTKRHQKWMEEHGLLGAV